MSTVNDVLNALQYRKDIQVKGDSLIPLINHTIKGISKRLYILGSSMIIDEMSVDIFKEVTSYETLSLDVAPGGAWAAGDTVTGVTSEATCEIVTVSTTTSYIVKNRVGTFTLGEVLSNGTYTADQGGTRPTCVSSMAFTASTSTVRGTITDANSWFVTEGFAADMSITTNHATNPGPFRIYSVAAGTLTIDLDDTVLLATGSSFKITSDASFGFLPDDFWGMVDKPYIDTKKYPLLPLPSLDTKLQYTSGEPIYYQIKGTKIYVVPATGSDWTIKADYFKKPTAITAKTDTLPFNEIFDDLIAEYLEKSFRGSKANDYVLLDKMLKDGVDLVASKYDKVAPVTTSGINWSRIVDECG